MHIPIFIGIPLVFHITKYTDITIPFKDNAGSVPRIKVITRVNVVLKRDNRERMGWKHSCL